MNNAKAIIKHWKERYNATKNPYFARCVFDATGDYPDDLTNFGFDIERGWVSRELEFINVPNMIY